MSYYRIFAVILLLLGVGVGYFVYHSETVTPDSFLSKPFKLGLDLRGGTRLVYDADTSVIQAGDVKDAMDSLREVIERRINVFGVSEPQIFTETAGLGAEAKHRLVVELPGVTNIDQALQLISKTPVLEFKTERPDGPEKEQIKKAYEQAQLSITSNASTTIESLLKANPLLSEDPLYVSTGLSGRYLKKASVSFSGEGVSGPGVSLEFNEEGAKLFAKITSENVGKSVAIYLDGQLLSAPNVREAIKDGRAEITGQFTVDEAKTLVRDLNLGALPLPIKLASSQTIGATLGQEAFDKGVKAGAVALAVIALFMIFWYRLPGLIAVISLSIYVAIMLALFKLIPVTLTAAGMAGLILSIGIAVDANVLIFERLKDELRRGKSIHDALLEGFSRAWLSIRDSNLSSIISAAVLFWFGTSLIKGFALTLMIGILVSMFSAITVTRTLLLALGVKHKTKLSTFLFGSGFTK
ncbi:MAG: protein translocase subunit SecD [Candidatus Vogelbacteria bacterium]|nr:protein translocase subunit SecD [Candidatus Vogelbacteria bacterium]